MKRILTLLLVLSACKPARAPRINHVTVDDESAPYVEPLSQKEAESIAAKVAAARGLSLKQPVVIENVSTSGFRKELESRLDEPDEHVITAEQTFLVGFDFLPPPSNRAKISSSSELMLDEVAAFYDTKSDKVYVPFAKATSAEEAFTQRAVLAHEVHHALQEQHFDLESNKPVTDDEALAHLALIEGDAMLAMAAYVGTEAGAPVGRTVRRIRETLKDIPPDAVAPRGVEASPMARALEITRQRLKFPYEEGMNFVGDVYRAGGFPLVNSMYTRFPKTTEQILHPEKYLAGETFRPIGDLAPIKNGKILGSGTMGELQMKVLLERCLSKDEAKAAAAGWAGDRFFALEVGSGKLAMAWVTAWDSDADAEEFEKGLRADCFGDNTTGSLGIGREFRVSRKKSVVAFVRGVEAEEQPGVLDGLVKLVGPAPAAVKWTDRTVPPLVPLPEPQVGTLEGDVHRNEWLGLVGRVPKGMKATLDTDTFDLFIERSGTFVAGGVSISTRMTTDELNETTFREVELGFKRVLKKHKLGVERLGGGDIKLEIGSGIERTWGVPGTNVHLRAILLPICAGTGSIVFIHGYADAFAKSVLDGWLGSYRLTNGRNMPACDYLDPK